MTTGDRVVVWLSAALCGVALFLAGFWAGGAQADTAHGASLDARPVPDWFLPIADAYDRNPAITPRFDFASLYSTEVANPTAGVTAGPHESLGPDAARHHEAKEQER
jgi:hypothetical protein